jgi:hypothetical protein
VCPGRRFHNDGFSLSLMTDVYCGSSGRFNAMELLVIVGSWSSIPATGGGVRRRRKLGRKGPGDLIVFSEFFRDLCAICLAEQLSSVSIQNVPGLCTVSFGLIHICSTKKKFHCHMLLCISITINITCHCCKLHILLFSSS